MKDQLNRHIKVDKTPERVISLVPSQTELLVDLGLESSIVGITKFCVHPAHLKENKTIVGGTKQVHLDRIKDLKPDIILCNKEENTKQMIQELESIATVHISDIYTIEDTLELIEMYGALFSKEDAAIKISQEISKKKFEFEGFIANKPKKTAAYFIWKDPWMVAAKDNFIDELLQLNGLENYYGHLSRYPEVLLDASLTENAELVLLSSEPFPFKEKHIQDIRPFFPKATIHVVDGELFSWYGSRLLKAFDYFKTLHQHQWA
ncbi:ABC transporter substrate-binding protein [Gelidibacter maritimus]|uniref:ABC transporter substrate-binding protein n=1 Tax=Gelidibacter maritimus TaxID=2761487 RepID=A0A7W2M598_9FLAO|nr:helical backbone metal receptor [Gelidibacter maritimus]MBA6152978.1 ABC transporter substrate-binding protein [Gelidibacter maritimus]